MRKIIRLFLTLIMLLGFCSCGGYDSSTATIENYEVTDSSFCEDEETSTAQKIIYETSYILNTNTMKFHYPDCKSASRIKDKNKDSFEGSRNVLIEAGYSPCGNCHP